MFFRLFIPFCVFFYASYGLGSSLSEDEKKKEDIGLSLILQRPAATSIYGKEDSGEEDDEIPSPTEPRTPVNRWPGSGSASKGRFHSEKINGGFGEMIKEKAITSKNPLVEFLIDIQSFYEEEWFQEVHVWQGPTFWPLAQKNCYVFSKDYPCSMPYMNLGGLQCRIHHVYVVFDQAQSSLNDVCKKLEQEVGHTVCSFRSPGSFLPSKKQPLFEGYIHAGPECSIMMVLETKTK